MNQPVRITEVAPRDGLQNEAGIIPTSEKADLVRTLSQTGVAEVEVTSFVSPKWIPQLGDAADLFKLLTQDLDSAKPARVQWSVLVPNQRGMDAAIRADLHAKETAGRSVIDKISVFTAASETFSQKNTNASIAETIKRFAPVIAAAKQLGKRTRGYISCIVECPFEGPIAPEKIGEVCASLLELGIDEIDLGDTIGAASAETISPALLAAIEALDGARTNSFGEPTLTLHLHDTFGRAAECVLEALTLGVRSFDGAAAGLGGCPYASVGNERAPGNIATELLVRTIEDTGQPTGVHRAKLAAAGAFAQRISMAAKMRAAAKEGSA